MNKYIITSLVECSLTFNNIESAEEFASKHSLNVCKVYVLNEHTPKLIGFGLENENGLLTGNELYVCGKLEMKI